MFYSLKKWCPRKQWNSQCFSSCLAMQLILGEFRALVPFWLVVSGHSELERSWISLLSDLFLPSAQNDIRGIYGSHIKLTYLCFKDICWGESYRPIICQLNLIMVKINWKSPHYAQHLFKKSMTTDLLTKCSLCLFQHFYFSCHYLFQTISYRDSCRKYLVPTILSFSSCAAFNYGL